MKKITLLFFSLSLLMMLSCKKEDEAQKEETNEETKEETTSNHAYLDTANCDGVIATFSADVQLILNASCATGYCHGTAISNGIELTDYAKTKSVFETFNVLCAINHGTDCSSMPLSGEKLSDEEIKIITCWAKNNFIE